MTEKYRVLLADDHALVRAGLRDALKNLPEIEIAGEVSNGRELSAALADGIPDLLVMDINMPDFAPVEEVRKMRAHFPNMKILVVSAYDDEEYVVGLLSAGVNGYHLKDQPLADLQMAVQRVLAGGRWLSDPLVGRLVQHSSEASAHFGLTRRQRELLYLLSKGFSNQKIAMMMKLSVKTVENHLSALYRAINVESRLEASNFARDHPDLLLIPKELPSAASSTQSMPVLVVDNNARYRSQLGKMILRNSDGVELLEAESASQAVEYARVYQPRLAFVDVVLDEEDGFHCVQQIKSQSPKTRIVLISAYPDREFRRLAFSSGAMAFLDKKDIDAATIRHVLEDALSPHQG
ncbi:MAG: response regulator transcription factor [Chloroflexota bacterium]